MKVPVINIGKSKGIKLSKSILDKYNISDNLVMILHEDHIILKPVAAPRAGWEDSFRQMHDNGEDQLLIDDVFEDEFRD